VTQPPDHAVVVDAVPDDVKPIADAIRKNECVVTGLAPPRKDGVKP